MRHTVWGILLVLAGCGGGADEYGEEYGSGGGELRVDPASYDWTPAGDLASEGPRSVSKAIEWQRMGTEMGAMYCGGALAVDKVLRHDAEDIYGVRVRLESRRAEALSIQWRILFYDIKGHSLIALTHDGNDTPWKSTVVEPHGYVTLTDSCRLKGAVAFRLFVRPAGTDGDGASDGFGKGR